MPEHKVDIEQFRKAKDFVIETLENQERTKEGLDKVGRILTKEIENSTNKDYKFSLLVLADEMSQYLEEFNQSQ